MRRGHGARVRARTKDRPSMLRASVEGETGTKPQVMLTRQPPSSGDEKGDLADLSRPQGRDWSTADRSHLSRRRDSPRARRMRLGEESLNDLPKIRRRRNALLSGEDGLRRLGREGRSYAENHRAPQYVAPRNAAPRRSIRSARKVETINAHWLSSDLSRSLAETA